MSLRELREAGDSGAAQHACKAAATYDYERPETWPADYRRWYEETVVFVMEDKGVNRAEAEKISRLDVAGFLRNSVEEIVTTQDA